MDGRSFAPIGLHKKRCLLFADHKTSLANQRRQRSMFCRVRDQLHPCCPAYPMNGINIFSSLFDLGGRSLKTLIGTLLVWYLVRVSYANCSLLYLQRCSPLSVQEFTKDGICLIMLDPPMPNLQNAAKIWRWQCDKTSPSLLHFILTSLLQTHRYRCVLSFKAHILAHIYHHCMTKCPYDCTYISTLTLITIASLNHI